jgi:RNAse (barnase) inhibitor barstar
MPCECNTFDAVKQFIIEGSRIYDIPSFYAEINRLFMQNESWQLGHSLDAFNDLLYRFSGGVVTLLWKDIAQSKAALGYEVTKRYYEEKLLPDSPFNKEHFREKLAELEQGSGQTYFDIVMEIIGEHANVKLVEA